MSLVHGLAVSLAHGPVPWTDFDVGLYFKFVITSGVFTVLFLFGALNGYFAFFNLKVQDVVLSFFGAYSGWGFVTLVQLYGEFSRDFDFMVRCGGCSFDLSNRDRFALYSFGV